ncbi:MAG: hypothetical protein II362_02065 [Alistipes sp.]|nr:hypothetical protein [Alistipes sp.]MBR0330789.1 hypothetical protein [Alistipes sp.]
MAIYYFSDEVSMGFSHCGEVMADLEGQIELTDEEAAQLVALMQETKSSDVAEMGLEQRYPDLYERLKETWYDAAYNAELAHWHREGFLDGYCEFDLDEVMEHCEAHCGYTFTFDPEEHCLLEPDDEEQLEELRREHFEAWLEEYVTTLSNEEVIEFCSEQLNSEVEDVTDPEGVEYEVAIPYELIRRAGLTK